MSPSDKIKAETNSNSGESQIQVCLKPCTMDTTSELSSASTSDVTLPGTIASIPMITASLSTLKCSNNDQMKTFDPGEESGIERLTSNHCGNSVLYGRNNCSSLNKNSNKNYKAGSKINKLADMLAKRSQNVVEVTQNNESNIISDITIASKIDETVTLTNVSNVINFEQNLNNPLVSFNKTVNNKELDSPRKSRRKSVPNQSCNLNQLHIQSTSKSCLDFSKLFLMKEDDKPECNALGEPLIKLQTDESTKRKAIRKNFKNVELTLILPEKKRRFSARNENTINSKINEKTLEITEAEVSCEEKKKNNCNTNVTATSSVQSPVNSFSSTNLKKESKVKQRKSKRLVETSTQTADIEFITVIKPKVDTQLKSTEENKESVSTDECLSCMEVFDIEQDCRSNQEKSQLLKNTKMFIKRQSCSKKLPSTDELKPNYVKKHSNKQAYCVKCIETFISKEKMHENNKEICIHKRTDDASRGMVEDASMSSIAREKNKDEVEEKQSDKKISKQNISKSDLNIDVSFDTNKKSSVSPRTVQKCSPKEMKTEEQLLEMEMLFYSHLSGNIQENLANHLDGKMDQNGCPIRTDKVMQPSECTPGKTKGGNLLSVVPPNAGVPDVQTSRAPSPYKTRSKTPNSLPPTAKKFKKLPNWQQKFWEKYNFPTNYRYEHRFWDKNYADTEKSAFYLKDLSCLDIKTQLTMRENIKKLDDLKLIEQDVKPVDNLKFPDYLSLMPRSRTGNSQVSQENKCDFQTSFSVSKGKKSSLKDREDSKKSFKSPETELPVTKSRRELSLDNLSLTKRLAEKTGFDGAKVMTRSQNSVDLMKDDAEEISSKRKGSLDLSGSQKMILRRQTSLDNLQKNSETALQKTDQLIDISLENTDSESGPSSPSGEIYNLKIFKNKRSLEIR